MKFRHFPVHVHVDAGITGPAGANQGNDAGAVGVTAGADVPHWRSRCRWVHRHAHRRGMPGEGWRGPGLSLIVMVWRVHIVANIADWWQQAPPRWRLWGHARDLSVMAGAGQPSTPRGADGGTSHGWRPG